MRTLNEEEQALIREYMLIDRKVRRNQVRSGKLSDQFYEGQSMTTRIQEVGGDNPALITVAFRVEDEVADMLDAEAEMKRTGEILRSKRQYFQAYLRSLTQNQRYYLKSKYINQEEQAPYYELEADVIENIEEIEDAVNRRFGFQVDDRNAIDRSIEDIISSLGV
ncbi:hypothetical protein [Alkalicoccus chagannorensis]|uniref:hypothetical protein n=1 Tax=Alkalicoccus chagannorensis TaxID=427072 RepID=UPI0003FFA8EC|nr:hypothetical protein [Alkalicoccus chagannorensis]